MVHTLLIGSRFGHGRLATAKKRVILPFSNHAGRLGAGGFKTGKRSHFRANRYKYLIFKIL